MFGIDDTFVWLAYVLCVASTILCVIYGLVSWNRGEDTLDEQDVRWATKEDKVEQEL